MASQPSSSQAPGSDSTAPASDPVIADATQGITALRTTSTWMIGAFSAIGALLVAGLKLSDLGNLATDEARFWVAIAAFVIGFIAVGVIIWFHVSVITPRSLTVSKLTAMEQKSEYPATYVHEADILGPYRKVSDVDDRLKTQRANQERWIALVAQRDAATGNARDRFDTELARLRTVLVQGAAELYPIERRMLAVGLYAVIWQRFRWARNAMLAAGLVIAAAIAVFAWAAAKPAPAPAAAPEFRVPVTAHLTLTSAGRTTLQGVLAPSCLAQVDHGAPIPVIVLSSEAGTDDVVVVPTTACPDPVRLTIRQPTDGRVVAARPVELSTPAATPAR